MKLRSADPRAIIFATTCYFSQWKKRRNKNYAWQNCEWSFTNWNRRIPYCINTVELHLIQCLGIKFQMVEIILKIFPYMTHMCLGNAHIMRAI